jgi:hypothetical protein
MKIPFASNSKNDIDGRRYKTEMIIRLLSRRPRLAKGTSAGGGNEGGENPLKHKIKIYKTIICV